ncbi:GNAT family N-acetyltransferase [Tabrizicola sp. M-4]|uniref:GNAT family N-acetyltransferase n=1 Tax=Tabrizicola sp. M-4 TaxID=3055847 RepID=UPI003DA87CE8
MPDLRPATKDDAAIIVSLMDMASHGMARALWAALTPPGEDPETFALRRAQRDTGGFSYRNTRILMSEGQPAGMIMCWTLPPEPLPTQDLPATARPLVELENLAPRHALYINALAVFPAHRRRGLARLMLAQAGQGPQALIAAAPRNPVPGPTVDVAARRAEAPDHVRGGVTPPEVALALYHAAGFREAARRPAQGDAHWQPDFPDWALLTR